MTKASLDGEASKLTLIFSSDSEEVKQQGIMKEGQEADLRQRIKVNWLKLGDSNPKFFSLATTVKRSNNSTSRV